MKGIGYFNTARLKMRQLTSGDLEDVMSLYETPVVKGIGNTQRRHQIIEALGTHLEHWDTHNFGYYIFEDKKTESFIGKGGLHRIAIDGKNEVEVSYALLPEYWNECLATEIIAKLIDIAFRKLYLTSLVGLALPDTESSKRALEKNGFVLEKQVMYKGTLHDFYRLTPHILKERALRRPSTYSTVSV